MIIDLTHSIEPGMPVYPGSQIPEIKDLDLYDELGVYVKTFSFDGHTGTHLDTPKHFYADGKSTSSLDISTFTGKAAIVDCSKVESGKFISPQIIEDANNLEENDFIIFYTGWSKKWGAKVDVISIDPINSSDTANHKTVLGAGKIIIENLTNLEQLLNKQFTFTCFPLKIKGGDGSPVRAVAIVE